MAHLAPGPEGCLPFASFLASADRRVIGDLIGLKLHPWNPGFGIWGLEGKVKWKLL